MISKCGRKKTSRWDEMSETERVMENGIWDEKVSGGRDLGLGSVPLFWGPKFEAKQSDREREREPKAK